MEQLIGARYRVDGPAEFYEDRVVVPAWDTWRGGSVATLPVSGEGRELKSLSRAARMGGHPFVVVAATHVEDPDERAGADRGLLDNGGLDLARAVLDGLAALHGAGWVHGAMGPAAIVADESVG